MKRILSRILFILLCSCCCVSVYAQQGVLHGEVIDKYTKTLLPKATVLLNKTGYITLTDTQGRYEIKNIPDGKYEVIVSFIGYKTYRQTVEIKSSGAAINFELEPVSYQLQDFVVTGTGTMHHYKSAPVATEVLGGDALKTYAGGSIEDILGGLSASFDFSANDMGANMQLNGLSNKYILILVDGKKLRSGASGQNDLNMINPAKIAKIEIVKGASSSLYGSDAIAGVINIITKKNIDKISVENSSRVGSYGEYKQYNAISVASGKWSSSTSFNLKRSGGWKNTSLEIYRDSLYKNSVTKTANEFVDYTVEEEINYKMSKRLSLYASGSYYRKNIYRPCGEPQYSTFGMEYDKKSATWGGKYLLDKHNILSLDFSYDVNKYNHVFTRQTHEEYVTEDGKKLHPVFYEGDVSLQTSEKTFNANAKGVFQQWKNHKLNTGLELDLNNLSSPYRILSGEKQVYTIAAYLQDEYAITKNFTLTSGLRGIGHEAFGMRLTPKISVLYKWGDFNWRATFSTGFKTPSLKELYYRYEKTMASKLRLYIGNPSLRPQTSVYYSVGAEYNISSVSLSVMAYYNKLYDMIALVEIPTTYEDKMREVDKTMKYNNMEKAVSQGIDFLFTYRIYKGLTWGGGYSYSHAQGDFLNKDNEIETVMIDGSALHHANTHVLWNHNWEKYALAVGVYGKIQSKRFYRYEGDAHGYTLWRINTNHKLLKTKLFLCEMNLGIDNIFNYYEDKPYGYNYGTKTPGRTWYAGVVIKYAK